jgi:hypothetical protein
MLVETVRRDPAVVAAFHRVVSRHGLAQCAALLHGDGETSGLPYRHVASWAARTDVVLNLAGGLVDPELIEPIPLRVYVDLDPAFTQLWSVAGVDVRLANHHRFVTVGRSIGTSTCPVPIGGVTWIGTSPPVVLNAWPATKADPRYGITTVGNWRSYGSVTHNGERYGQRAHSLRRIIDLPQRAPVVSFQPALAIHPSETDDLRALRSHGWKLVDPLHVSSSPERYKRFISWSTAELCVAKEGYVRSSCGWFSDRSVCYLAAGRPVVAQETGWSAWYPQGEGLVAFTSADEAAAAVSDVIGSYDRHCKAARAIAEDIFDARKVLRQLLRSVGADER